MAAYVRREEEHRAGFPRTGDGAHYLRGDPPFWRQPWPENWRVAKPWEFARLYDQNEMRTLLKHPDLSEFNGNKDDYAQWQRRFKQTVHVQDIDINQKYSLLLKYIAPSVKASITGGLGYSDLDYCFAVSRLERNYGLGVRRPETEVESITTFRPFGPQDLRRANDFVHRLESYLGRGQVDPAVATLTVLPAIKRVVPNTWMEDCYRWVQNNNMAFNPHTVLNYLKTLLDTKANMLPYQANNAELRRRPPVANGMRTPPPTVAAVRPPRTPPLASTPTKPLPEPSRSVVMVTRSDAIAENCVCCGGGHLLKECRRFSARVGQRRTPSLPGGAGLLSDLLSE